MTQTDAAGLRQGHAVGTEGVEERGRYAVRGEDGGHVRRRGVGETAEEQVRMPKLEGFKHCGDTGVEGCGIERNLVDVEGFELGGENRPEGRGRRGGVHVPGQAQGGREPAAGVILRQADGREAVLRKCNDREKEEEGSRGADRRGLRRTVAWLGELGS